MLNRILGILVVLAISVLAYPFVFNSHNSFVNHSKPIPAPAFPSVQAQQDTIQAIDKNDKNIKPLSVKQKIHSTKLAHDERHKNRRPKIGTKNTAWVVQMGSYRDKTKALSLVNQLRAKGYNAFIQQKNAALGKEIQVLIGPEGKKDAAILTANKLSKEVKLSGEVKIYKLWAA